MSFKVVKIQIHLLSDRLQRQFAFGMRHEQRVVESPELPLLPCGFGGTGDFTGARVHLPLDHGITGAVQREMFEDDLQIAIELPRQARHHLRQLRAARALKITEDNHSDESARGAQVWICFRDGDFMLQAQLEQRQRLRCEL